MTLPLMAFVSCDPTHGAVCPSLIFAGLRYLRGPSVGICPRSLKVFPVVPSGRLAPPMFWFRPGLRDLCGAGPVRHHGL
jgi:hypothetical protein